MKDKVTKTTWYSVLVLSAAISMSVGFAALIGVDLNQLNFVAFGAMGLATLFLAAERNNTRKAQNGYFFSFLLALFGYIFAGVEGVIAAALAWPLLFYTETRQGAKIMPQLQMLLIAELARAVFAMLVLFANMTHLGLYLNIFGVLSAIARGWGAYILLKSKVNNKGENE